MEDSSIIGFLIFWLLLSFCVGIVGNEKKIGYWGVVLCSILLSPIVGLIIGLLSPPQTVKEIHKYKIHIELGKKSEYKGELKDSINHYMDGLFHLENDYKHFSFEKWNDNRLKLIEQYKNKVEELKNSINNEGNKTD